jgi:predicted amidophosphoribosyltransferase
MIAWCEFSEWLGQDVDVRVLVSQSQSMLETHFSQNRPEPHELYRNYEVDDSLAKPTPVQIAVVDDVLTTGAHFKAMKMVLEDSFRGVQVVGLFLARRVPDTE